LMASELMSPSNLWFLSVASIQFLMLVHQFPAKRTRIDADQTVRNIKYKRSMATSSAAQQAARAGQHATIERGGKGQHSWRFSFTKPKSDQCAHVRDGSIASV
jgi:S-formylglutathione hydrolase FrmB